MFLYLIVVVFLLSRVYQHSKELYSKFNAENGDGEHEKSRLRDIGSNLDPQIANRDKSFDVPALMGEAPKTLLKNYLNNSICILCEIFNLKYLSYSNGCEIFLIYTLKFFIKIYKFFV